MMQAFCPFIFAHLFTPFLRYFMTQTSHYAGLNRRLCELCDLKKCLNLSLSILFLLTLTFFTCFTANAQVESDAFDLSIKKLSALQSSEAKTLEDPKHGTQVLSHGRKTKYVLLSLPGLHESPFHLKALNQFFFDEGANVLSLHLPGHQQKNQNAIDKVKAKEWEDAVSEAIAMAHGLGDEIIVLGYSTGGVLAVQAALQRPKEISQLYLFAPALALSNRTFLFALFGQLAMGAKLCDIQKPGLMCEAFESLDHQTIQMMKEGVYPSAAAGIQVQRVIDDIKMQFSDSAPNDYYPALIEAYSQLTVPTFLVSSMADSVTTPIFNRTIFESWTMRKHIVEYPKNLNVTHLMISKSKSDALPHSPNDSYNPYFPQLLPQIKIFWKGGDL
jgi:alpha-beta hydrolase superfamily lysophospholipase